MHVNALFAVLLSIIALAPGGAWAVPGGLATSSNQPAFVEANSMDYDVSGEIVIASGNVEVIQGERILMAESLIYNQKTNIVTARGKVSLMEPDGQVYFAEEAVLKDDLKDGVIQHFRLRFADNSLLAANSAIRTDASKIELEKAVYSSCKLCPTNPEKAPFWQVKANRVKVDEIDQRVSYRHAFMELYGVPVAYTPYLSHPTPGADRKSGFLAPTYSAINTLGATIETPYYHVIDSTMDVTVAPIFTSQEGPVLQGQFRHMPHNGYYVLEGSITNPDERDTLNRRTGERDIRGHIQAKGIFDVGDDWQLGFDGKRSTDKTYLRRYKLGNEDLLTSRLYIEKLSGRSYTTVDALAFQGLSVQDNADATPYLSPLVNLYRESTPGAYGDRWSLIGNSMILSRNTGVQSRRLSSTVAYNMPYITDSGQVLGLTTSLRGDVYSVDNVNLASLNPDGTRRDYSGLVGRAIPQGELSWSYPMVKQAESYRMIVEPVTNFIISPHGGNSDRIPNEDSQDVELSEVNLFSDNRFTGYDLVEGGPRVNYGVRSGIYNELGSVNALLGQNYRVKRGDSASPEGGISEKFSDFAGSLVVSNDKYLDAYYRFRLDKDNFNPRRSEVGTQIRLDPVTFLVDYIALDKDPTRGEKDGRKEVFTAGSVKLNDNWGVMGNARRDVSTGDGGYIAAGAGLLYGNDCFQLSTIFNREFTQVRDLEPSTSVTVQVSFKNLN